MVAFSGEVERQRTETAPLGTVYFSFPELLLQKLCEGKKEICWALES